MKLVWEPEIADEDQRPAVTEMVERAGSSRVILCRCDDSDAIEYGQAIGINMFQGRHIERLIAEENRRREIEMARRQPLTGEFIE